MPTAIVSRKFGLDAGRSRIGSTGIEWKYVDVDIKEAVDRREAGKPNVAFHVLKALKCAIKIIPDCLGRKHGAADFVDNLAAKNPDIYVEVRESEALKALFKDPRNPMGNGARSSAAMQLTAQQTPS